ncbi:MAG: hypothetical protein P8X66_10045, partial [Maritimibacter sp.]
MFSLSPLQAADINGTSETVIGGGGGTISSPWNIYDHLYVGRTTTGDLTISNGGYTGSETGYIGFEVGSTGAVTVTGSGSEWVNSSDLFVGLAGGGTLAVSDGGTVSSTGGFLGYGAGSTGNATISGAGSSWSTQNPLFVGLSGTGDLTLTDGGLVSVGDGSKTVALGLGETGTGTLNIGAAAGSAAAAAGTLQAGKVTLSTTSDRLVFNHTDGAYSFGPDITGFGGILQYSGTTTLAGDMTGFTGNIYADGGRLAVTDGSQVHDGNAYIGYNTGSNAKVLVSGGSSVWTNTGALSVGADGTGTMVVENGGTVTSATGTLGQSSTGFGIVSITGAGSSWNITGGLDIGLNGVGQLTLADAGLLTVGGGSGTVDLAYNGGAGGELVIGAARGESAIAAGSLNAGSVDMGDGDARILFNHTDSAYSFGADINGSGQIILDAGTTMFAGDMAGYTGALMVNNGTLAITSATPVHSREGIIGLEAGTSGTAVIDGDGADWDMDYGLSVGLGGRGDLAVQNGGTITMANGNSFLGYSTGSTGAATVEGTGSRLDSRYTIHVGYYGTGELTLADGGTASVNSGAGSLYLGRWAGSTGTLNIGAAEGDAAASAGTLDVSALNFGAGTGTLYFNHTDAGYVFAPDITGSGTITLASGTTGFSGDMSGFTGGVQVNDGVLDVAAGQSLQGQSGHIGYAAGSDGQAIVAGSGASWATTYNLYAGYEGDGALTVSNGGQVSDEFGFVGTKSTSTGSVTVTGAGSRWVNSNHLFIGTHGHGALTISDGATVESIDGYLGTEAIGGGSALVTGSGSDWAMSGDLYVGGNGSGALTLSDDGTVTVGGGSAYLGLYSGSTGTLYIGAASGDAAVGAGTVEATALTFGAGTGTLVFNHTDTDYDFAPDITGAGTISHLAGVTNLTGNNSGFSGTTSVSGGLLNVDGMLGGTLTLAGGSLGGNGTLGTLNVASGTLAPGHSVGTLNVGDLSFDAGSTYAVELNDGGFVAGTNNDFINATGTINITGGTVHVAPDNGTDAGETYSTGSYTIATAAGGVSGTFDSITDDYLFLDFTLGYDASNIILTSEQVAAFQNVALTPNQIAAAAAAETLGSGNAVYDALLGVATEEEARAGYDALSGEAYATLASGFLQSSRYPREAMLGQEGGDGTNRWASAYGGMMSLGSDGNAAAARAYAGGLIAGIDKGFT